MIIELLTDQRCGAHRRQVMGVPTSVAERAKALQKEFADAV